MSDQKEMATHASDKSESLDKLPRPMVQLVVFNLADEEYAVEINNLQEIVRMPVITPVPGADEFIQGVFNLRGKVVVVLDLKERLRQARTISSASERIIIFVVNGNICGVVVDKVRGIINIEESAVQPPSKFLASKIKTDYIKGVVAAPSNKPTKPGQSVGLGDSAARSLILLDINKMLGEKILNTA